MLDGIKEFFSAMPYIAWSIVSLLVALLVISQMWDKVKWWWHNTWYSFPLIGKIASLSKDTNKDSINSSWFKAEKTLCRDYKKFIQIQDKNDYDEKVSYITKAGDNGRKPTPALIWPLTFVLVIVEALGFSYVLAGYTIPGASENLQGMGALGIALLISVILVAFTHFSGHEIFVYGQVKQARQEWIEGGRIGKTHTKKMPLAQPQSGDDDQPGYVQLMNRVGSNANLKISFLTAIIVIVIAIGATYVRGQVLEKLLQQDTVGQTTNSSTKDALDMSAKDIVLPDADANANANATKKAVDDKNKNDEHGGWGTFIVLAFIFVFLQILGVIFGFKWGFAGQNSAAAYKAIGGGRYTSYADVRAHYKEIADMAQSKLENLQQKIMDRNGGSGTDGMHLKGSFHQFMQEENEREADDSQHSNRLADRVKAVALASKSQPATAFTAVSVESLKAPSLVGLEGIMGKIDSMGDDKEAIKIYIKSLSDDIKAQVMQALKAKKEEAAKRASAADSELDDLLS